MFCCFCHYCVFQSQNFIFQTPSQKNKFFFDHFSFHENFSFMLANDDFFPPNPTNKKNHATFFNFQNTWRKILFSCELGIISIMSTKISSFNMSLFFYFINDYNTTKEESKNFRFPKCMEKNFVFL